MKKLYVVGIGPGDLHHLTPAASAAIAAAEVVVGYQPYLDLIAPLLTGKELVSSGMMKEVERCRIALERAVAGQITALVSSGDAGIYGMAGLALELAADLPEPPEIEVVPGISAVQAAAAVLGAPLMHDFAVISLSDLLTPWTVIRHRLTAAASADFVIALYNPKSKGRVTQIAEARHILLASRPGTTPVGIVRNALRVGQERIVTTLEAMLEHDIDMFSLVIIGNRATVIDQQGRMVTPRGYATNAQGSGLRARAGQNFTGVSNLEPRTPSAGKARSLMICGTGSDVGKSVLTAGICRILKNRGYTVAPFKSQNMALNSAVTPEGGEIGRAQAVQAEACGIPPHTDMNPILLKPTCDLGSQIIVQGKVVGTMRIAEYTAYKPAAFARAKESYARLVAKHDMIVIEGAGSIAEINLKANDIANLAVAEMADCPVIVVADIDRGGVFAQIIGTWELLEPHERNRVVGFIINKFRGDASLLTSGLALIEERTGKPVLGVVPWLTDLRLPAEDSVALQKRAGGSGLGARGETIVIGVVKLPRISNFTDFDALEAEADVTLCYIEGPEDLDGLDALILPGSKATIADLFFLMERGLFGAIKTFTGPIIGVCGGFQMLGRRVLDPDHLDADISEAEGLGLLDAETVMLANKETHQVTAELTGGAPFFAGCSSLTGYEIHLGQTSLGTNARPFATINRRSGKSVTIADGAVSADGRVMGTYLHGIFDNADFRHAFLNRLRYARGLSQRQRKIAVIDPFDHLAAHLEQHLDIPQLLARCGVTI